MPRSVYVVKGEGVRDSVWTPKAALSSPSIAHLPELVQTVPSPNFSVNPVVQVFAQLSATPSRLAPNTTTLPIPNHASLIQNAISSLTGRLSPLPSAPLTQQTLPPANAQPALQLSAPLSSSPNPASARNTARSAHPPFPAYNRSPMVFTVLHKKTKSGQPTNRASSLQTDSLTQGEPPSRSPEPTSALPQQPNRKTNANNAPTTTHPPLPLSPTNSTPTAARKDRPRSPSSPVKPPQATKKLSLNEEAYVKEKRRVLGDLVERRKAHRREKSGERSGARSLTPISKLIEDASQTKSSSKKGLCTQGEATSVRVENPQIEAPTIANKETAGIANPLTLADSLRRRGSGEKSVMNGNGVRTVSHSVENGLQRTQREKRDMTAVGDHYLALIKSLFALAAQAEHEGRRNDGLAGSDLTLYMKKRVLAAFATHTRERASVLNKKALKLLMQSKLCKSDVARLARLTNAEASGAVQPLRRSKKSEVRRQDIDGLKAMLLSWERFSSGKRGNVDQFHLDVVHLKCIAEALEDGTHVSVSNRETFALFKELVLVNAGIELIYDAVGGLKAMYKNGNRECVRPWFRSTDGLLTWHVYMRRRMVEMLAIVDEPFASELKKYCKLFSYVDDSKVKQKIGEGIKIGSKLRDLKKQIRSLWQDEQGNELQMEDEYCQRTTSYLAAVSKSFAKLVRYMTTLSATPKATAEGNADGSGGSSREGSPEKARRRDDGELGAWRKNSVVPRQMESRARREENRGSLNKGVESKSAVRSGGANEENARSRVVNDVRSPSEDVKKRRVMEERRTHPDRGRGREGDGAKHYSSLPSIPRRPAKEDSGGAGGGARGGSVRSNGSAVGVDRRTEKSGPAAIVHRMLLANAAAPATPKSRKRKRGEGILQRHDSDGLDEMGMRAGRKRAKRIGFSAKTDVRGNPPAADAESLRTLFSDGESWMLSANAVQKAAIGERNARLSREAVETCFGFLRTFVWQHKCMKDGRTFVMPRYLPNPSTPSAVREMSRRVVSAPLPPR